MSQYANIVTKSGGGALPPELDPHDEGLVYGGTAARCWGALDRFALDLGVPTLSSFEIPEVQDMYKEEDVGWHDPGEGLRSVRAIRSHLMNSPDESLRRQLNDAFLESGKVSLLWDLEVYEALLKKAADAADQFGFVIC